MSLWDGLRGTLFDPAADIAVSHALGVRPSLAGLMVTLCQIGYCVGLLFVAPLADLLENRRLLLVTLAASALFMAIGDAAPNGAIFLAACVGVGVASTSVQMVVAQAAALTALNARGRVVGRVTSGLLFGILLAGPVVIANRWGGVRLLR